jgi:hypothetical protein
MVSVHGFAEACIRGQGGFRCGEDVYPSSRVQRIIEILQSAFVLGQFGILAISCFHGFWDNFVSSSCLYTLWYTCFKCSVVQWWEVFLICVCVILASFMASASECSFPAIWQCPGIHCSAICLSFALSCPIRTWQSLASVDITVSLYPANIIAAFESVQSRSTS